MRSNLSRSLAVECFKEVLADVWHLHFKTTTTPLEAISDNCVSFVGIEEEMNTSTFETYPIMNYSDDDDDEDCDATHEEICDAAHEEISDADHGEISDADHGEVLEITSDDSADIDARVALAFGIAPNTKQPGAKSGKQRKQVALAMRLAQNVLANQRNPQSQNIPTASTRFARKWNTATTSFKC